MSPRTPLRAAPFVALLAAGLACASGPGEAPPPPRIAPATGPGPAPVEVPGPCDPCVLLLHNDLAELIDGGFCRLCGEQNPAACEGFPHAPPVTCAEYDWLRNCMYARLGYDFEGAEEWRVEFEDEGWYRPDPAFRFSRVSGVQADNARGLKEIVRDGDCVD